MKFSRRKASQNTRSPISGSQADPFRDSLRLTVKVKLRIARLLSLLGQPGQAQASLTLKYLNLPSSSPPPSLLSLSSLSSLPFILLSIFWLDPLEDTGHGPPLEHWLQSGLVPALNQTALLFPYLLIHHCFTTMVCFVEPASFPRNTPTPGMHSWGTSFKY